MAHPIRFGLMIRPQDLPIDRVLDVFRLADDAGFDHMWLPDHILSLGELDRPIFDGWMVLAAAATVTKRVRIGLHVTGNLYRHPSMLAKQSVTVDHLSGGRLEMGLGAGWKEVEFDTLGIPFPPSARERIERLGEACVVLKSLWTEARSTFAGKYYQLSDAIGEPKPLQRPHPPLWIGGSGLKRTLRIVAREADVWSTDAATPEDEQAAWRALDEHCRAIGRDPSSIRRCVQIRWADRKGLPSAAVGDLASDIDAIRRAVERYVGLGYTEIILMVNAGDGVTSLKLADLYAHQVLPRVKVLS